MKALMPHEATPACAKDQFRAHDRRCAEAFGKVLDAKVGPELDAARLAYEKICLASRAKLRAWISRPLVISCTPEEYYGSAEKAAEAIKEHDATKLRSSVMETI